MYRIEINKLNANKATKSVDSMSTQSQYRRYRTSGSHDYAFLSSYKCTFKHNKSSSYYKTKHLISPDFSLGIPLGSIRYFHISSQYNEKDKSFVEKAVEVLKDKKRTDKKVEEVSEKELQPGVEKEKLKIEKTEEKLSGDQQSTVVKAKPTLLQTIKKHGKFYLDGFVLFFKELRIAVSYLWKRIVKGETLTRRELKQLRRTSADIFRMIPYLIFIIIPFFEFLIPVYLKLFPNALPSTFGRDEKKPDVLLKEGLKRKQEMAKLLQETLQQTSLERKKKDAPSMVMEFTDFMEKVRSEGIAVSNEEILHFSTMFEDEVTIDSLTRGQLQALCRVLGIIPIGTDQMLRFQLDIKLRRLLVDDKMIQKEGIESLTVQELQQANRARGMRALGVDKERLIFQLEQWLDLHLNQHVPTSLLLLSRALYLPEHLSPVEQLQKTIQSLPKTATAEATVRVAAISGERIDPATRIEILKSEQEAIAKETKLKAEENELKKQKQIQKEEEEAEAIAARVAMEGEVLVDNAPEIAARAEEVQELQQANRARGMRALGVDKERLIFQLEQWLDLHLNQHVPTSLLLLSRALYLPEHLSPVEQLQKTIQSLPKTATAEATVRVAAISGERIDPATRIEILKSEQEAIAKETKLKAEENELKKQKQIQKEEEEAEAIAARVAMEGEVLVDNAPEIAARAEEEIKVLNTDEELSSEDLKEIESAIENIAMEKKFNIDEEILQDLKEDVDEYKEDLEDLKSVMLASGGDEEDIKESKSAKRLGKKVDKLVTQLDVKLDELHKKRLRINEEIDLKEKNLIYADIDDIETRDEVMQKISEKKGLVISINDMVLALRRLQKVPDEVRLQKIVTVLDEDKDGIIDASHVLKVIKLLGQENVKLESSQVSELIDLCKKEMQIEEEEKQKEKVEKEKEKQEKTLKENSGNNEETLKQSSE
ncbi:LETM1 [Mytilus coruscus]|uniref:Mitochondrial proton/calcium exchanger protein n=1 Tax=Mytilus coruscus TaxID=42192 RepID=A0A6J8EPJ0_MYTCO|nr:LETM1 [Mytilus coruscus]